MLGHEIESTGVPLLSHDPQSSADGPSGSAAAGSGPATEGAHGPCRAAPSLDTLPAELLAMILARKELSLHDTYGLRFLCRSVGGAATAEFYRRASATVAERNLAILKEFIRENRATTSVVVGPNILPDAAIDGGDRVGPFTLGLILAKCGMPAESVMVYHLAKEFTAKEDYIVANAADLLRGMGADGVAFAAHWDPLLTQTVLGRHSRQELLTLLLPLSWFLKCLGFEGEALTGMALEAPLEIRWALLSEVMGWRLHRGPMPMILLVTFTQKIFPTLVKRLYSELDSPPGAPIWTKEFVDCVADALSFLDWPCIAAVLARCEQLTPGVAAYVAVKQLRFPPEYLLSCFLAHKLPGNFLAVVISFPSALVAVLFGSLQGSQHFRSFDRDHDPEGDVACAHVPESPKDAVSDGVKDWAG
ncbi:hypothetical protein DFJ74DRAFT_363839 [Hyaloraphidium curvatum]|nr:hypothetical protein DFJ74DRAFT_363839 [Hyaloraphidium curvatum]